MFGFVNRNERKKEKERERWRDVHHVDMAAELPEVQNSRIIQKGRHVPRHNQQRLHSKLLVCINRTPLKFAGYISQTKIKLFTYKIRYKYIISIAEVKS